MNIIKISVSKQASIEKTSELSISYECRWSTHTHTHTHTHTYIYIYIYIYIRSAYDKFPDFFRVGTFIDSTHMKL